MDEALITISLMILCLLAEGFFSGSEIGIVSADQIKLRHAAATRIREKFGPAEIFDAILNPSAAIAFGYDSWVIEDDAGRPFRAPCATCPRSPFDSRHDEDTREKRPFPRAPVAGCRPPGAGACSDPSGSRPVRAGKPHWG